MLHEIKRSKIHTISEFVKEYAMIVVGILTALTLEHIAVYEHNRESAEKSRARLVKEMQENLNSVKHALEENKHRQQPVQADIAALEDDIRKGLSKADINKHLHELGVDKLIAGLNEPANQHEAWDVGLADQSLTHIDDDSLHRFASSYADQRELAAIFQEDMRASNFSMQIEDMMLDLKFDQADPMATLKALGSLNRLHDEIHNLLNNMQSDLTDTLKEENKAHHNH